MGLAASLGEEARLVEAGLIEVPWPVPVADADGAGSPGLSRAVSSPVRRRAAQMALLSLNEARRLIARDGSPRRRRSLRAPLPAAAC
jgi:hypothetical protein